MADPLRTLKFLPWGSLLKISALTTLIVAAIDYFLVMGYQQYFIIYRVLRTLFMPPLGLLIVFAVAVGVGVFAVYLLERLEPQLSINTSILWALVPCLVLILIVKSLLPIPSLLLELNQIQLMAMILGIFWKGRPYWR